MTPEYRVTAIRVVGLVILYAALLVSIRADRRSPRPDERKTFYVVGGTWAICVFIANYLLFRAGLMSFLPWPNNFLHTFVWIGVCLSFLYFGVRATQPLAIQMVLFATFSIIVKYAEQLLFGTWDLDNFFHVFHGNFAYVLGWSLADGLYPPLTLFGLRLLSRWVRGLEIL